MIEERIKEEIRNASLNPHTINALTSSFIWFRLSAPLPSITSITPLQYYSLFPLSFPNQTLQPPPPPPVSPISTSLLASNVAGKPIWQSHLRPKDGGGLQRAHFWLCRGGRARARLSQSALIIFRFMWWPLPFFCVCQRVYVCVHMCVCCLNDS